MSEEGQEMSIFIYASDLNCLQNMGGFVALSQLSAESVIYRQYTVCECSPFSYLQLDTWVFLIKVTSVLSSSYCPYSQQFETNYGVISCSCTHGLQVR